MTDSHPARNYDAIYFYEGKFYFFSNLSSFAVEWNGRIWMTSEHAYQAAKFSHLPEIMQQIFEARSAEHAKRIGRDQRQDVIPGWRERNIAVMEEICRAKLEQHPYIREQLPLTGEREIIEDSPTDPFWGRGPNYDGRNELGKIWMRLRAELAGV